MQSLRLAVLIIFVFLIFPLVTIAQDDDTPLPTEGNWLISEYSADVDCFGMEWTETLADLDEDAELTFTLLGLNDGEVLIRATGTEDFQYIQMGTGEYAGQFLDPLDEGFVYTSTLSILSADEMIEEAELIIDGECIYAITSTYVADTATTSNVWAESEREFTEATISENCFGLPAASLGTGFADNDFVFPLQFDEDDLSLHIGSRTFNNEGETYIYRFEDESEGMHSLMEILLTPSEFNDDGFPIAFSVEGINELEADGCSGANNYVSTYTLIEAEDLLTAIEELTAESSEEE